MRADLRVLVADDHPMFRLGLAMALRQLGFGHVVEAHDGQAAIEACEREQFEVVVLDVKMPRVNGFDAARAILGRQDGEHEAPKVILLSTFDQPALIRAGTQIGISAFLGKETLPSRLAEVIDSFTEGNRHTCGVVLSTPTLTERERAVLRCLCQGASTKVIAAHLGISSETVKDHLSRLYGKLNVPDRAAAVDAAHRLGWVELERLDRQGEPVTRPVEP